MSKAIDNGIETKKGKQQELFDRPSAMRSGGS